MKRLEKLEKSRTFQKDNFDAKTGDVKTEMGAGVMLYSVSGSARASAKEARKVEEEISKARRDGRLAECSCFCRKSSEDWIRQR